MATAPLSTVLDDILGGETECVRVRVGEKKWEREEEKADGGIWMPPPPTAFRLGPSAVFGRRVALRDRLPDDIPFPFFDEGARGYVDEGEVVVETRNF